MQKTVLKLKMRTKKTKMGNSKMKTIKALYLCKEMKCATYKTEQKYHPAGYYWIVNPISMNSAMTRCVTQRDI